MTYELVKKLKDNGFSLTKFDEVQFIINGMRRPDKINDAIRIDRQDYFIPTLSELIEACIEIDEKINIFNDYSSLGWIVQSGWYCDDDSCDYLITIVDDVLEQALAKLWLALNENKRPV